MEVLAETVMLVAGAAVVAKLPVRGGKASYLAYAVISCMLPIALN